MTRLDGYRSLLSVAFLVAAGPVRETPPPLAALATAAATVLLYPAGPVAAAAHPARYVHPSLLSLPRDARPDRSPRWSSPRRRRSRAARLRGDERRVRLADCLGILNSSNL